MKDAVRVREADVAGIVENLGLEAARRRCALRCLFRTGLAAGATDALEAVPTVIRTSEV